MKIEIEARGVPVEDDVPLFIRTTIVFSTWRHDPRVDRVRVTLRDESHFGSKGVLCGLRAFCSDGSSIFTTATGESLFASLTEASNLLELELFRSLSRPVDTAAGLVAA